jgi:hypothetical protein
MTGFPTNIGLLAEPGFPRVTDSLLSREKNGKSVHPRALVYKKITADCTPVVASRK